MKNRMPTAVMVCILSAAMLSLSGCSVNPRHDNWASRISQSDAVISADWNHVNNWPAGGSTYTGRVSLDPTMTEEQAREIVKVSCSERAIFDEIFYEARSLSPEITAVKRGLTGVCSDEEELAGFSRILDVLEQQPASFAADVIVWSYETTIDSETEEEVTRPPSMRAEMTTVDDLFTFARQAHDAAGGDTPFEFTGSVDDDVSLITNFGKEVSIDVPADYDLFMIFPILTDSYRLEHEGISYTPDTGIVVAMNDAEKLLGGEVARVRELARASGVRFEPRLADTPFGTSEASELRQLFINDLARLPAVEAATFEENASVVVTATSLAGIDGILAYFEQHSGEHMKEFDGSFTSGEDRVLVMLQNSENDALTIRLQGGIPSLSDLRTVVDSATRILTDTAEIKSLQVQSWPDKIRVFVEFEEHAATTSIESAKLALRELLPLTTVARIDVGRVNGASEELRSLTG